MFSYSITDGLLFVCNYILWPRADLNECESSPCSQECANVYGSYQCYCRRGYQLSDMDGLTCEGKLEPEGYAVTSCRLLVC